MKNISLRNIVALSLFVGQACLAATYTPPDGSNPGVLQFNNILLNTGENVSVTLTAKDNAALYGGQPYELVRSAVGMASGEQDGEYNEFMQRIIAKDVMESSTIMHDVVLYSADILNDQEEHVFTIVGLRSVAYGAGGNVLKQNLYINGSEGSGAADEGAPSNYVAKMEVRHGRLPIYDESAYDQGSLSDEFLRLYKSDCKWGLSHIYNGTDCTLVCPTGYYMALPMPTNWPVCPWWSVPYMSGIWGNKIQWICVSLWDGQGRKLNSVMAYCHPDEVRPPLHWEGEE